MDQLPHGHVQENIIIIQEGYQGQQYPDVQVTERSWLFDPDTFDVVEIPPVPDAVAEAAHQQQGGLEIDEIEIGPDHGHPLAESSPPPPGPHWEGTPPSPIQPGMGQAAPGYYPGDDYLEDAAPGLNETFEVAPGAAVPGLDDTFEVNPGQELDLDYFGPASPPQAPLPQNAPLPLDIHGNWVSPPDHEVIPVAPQAHEQLNRTFVVSDNLEVAPEINTTFVVPTISEVRPGWETPMSQINQNVPPRVLFNDIEGQGILGRREARFQRAVDRNARRRARRPATTTITSETSITYTTGETPKPPKRDRRGDGGGRMRM